MICTLKCGFDFALAFALNLMDGRVQKTVSFA